MKITTLETYYPNSSLVEEARWATFDWGDRSEEGILVRLNGGRHYFYPTFYENWKEFQQASSPGAFYNAHLKGMHNAFYVSSELLLQENENESNGAAGKTYDVTVTVDNFSDLCELLNCLEKNGYL